MPLDPTKYADWQIAEAAELQMKTVYKIAEGLGLERPRAITARSLHREARFQKHPEPSS